MRPKNSGLEGTKRGLQRITSFICVCSPCFETTVRATATRSYYYSFNISRCCHNTSTVLRRSKSSIARASWSTPRELPTCLLTPAAVTFQAQFGFRCYSSRTVPPSLSTNVMDTDAQRANQTEIKGRSGRRYKIERVLQDKGDLLGRVFLATYVILNRVAIGY
jgi:hypothetical protein